jgi:hypothetical protein
VKTVLVFKTTVERKQDVDQLRPLLDQLITPGERWNFDLEDCDNILRVESRQLDPWIVTSLLAQHGFYCTELED